MAQHGQVELTVLDVDNVIVPGAELAAFGDTEQSARALKNNQDGPRAKPHNDEIGVTLAQPCPPTRTRMTPFLQSLDRIAARNRISLGILDRMEETV